MQELRSLKIDLFLHQQGLDTTTPAGKMMFQVLGSFAEYERDMIRARVNAGIARAKAQGKHCGRPPLASELGCPRPSWHPGDRQAVRCIADDGAERHALNTLQYIPRVADQAVLTRAMIKDMFWATCISISVVSAVNVLLWVWGAL